MFNIEIIWKKWKKFIWRIQAWRLDENFIIYFKDLNKREILDLWKSALNILLYDENSKTVVVTSINSWYVFHRRKNYIYITERIFDTNIITHLVNKSYDFLPEKEKNRKLTQKEILGYKNQGIVYEIIPKLFSEWKIQTVSLIKYVNKIN